MSSRRLPSLQALQKFTSFLSGVKKAYNNSYIEHLVGDLEAIKRADIATLQPIIDVLKQEHDLPYDSENLESAIKLILFILSIISDPKLKERVLQLIENEYNAREYEEDRISIDELLSIVNKPEYKVIFNNAMLALANYDTSRFASSLPVHKATDIISRGKHLNWSYDQYNKLTHTHSFLQGKGVLFFQVTSDETQTSAPETLAGAAAHTVINSFDIRAACVHLIYASHLTELNNPTKDQFIINADDVITILGMDKNRNINRQQKLDLIKELALQPSRIIVHGRYPQQGQKKGFDIQQTRMWDVGITEHINEKDLRTSLSIQVRAGMWAQLFFNQVGKEGLLQYGHVSRNLLQTITSVWQHNEGAARIMLWLLFKVRISGSHDLRFKVKTLMAVAYDPESIAAAQNERRLRSSLAKRWANDLRTLHNKGNWKVTFDDNDYPIEIQPELEPGNFNEDPIMMTGFWGKLLAASVSFEAPAEIAKTVSGNNVASREHPVKPVRTRPTKKTVNQQDSQHNLTSDWIANARKKLGLSQRQLAVRIGRSQSWLAQVELGSKKIPKDLLSTIQKSLTSP